MSNNDEVNILLAIYKPNLNFLEKQLESLDKQTYKNIKVSIIDDSENEFISKEIKNVIEKKLKNVKYEFEMNKKNIGSNRTFEKLTLKSKSKYLAYCDQDDIWEHEKIEKLVNLITKDNSLIVYSDLSVIDAQGKIISSSFKNINPRLEHVYGKDKFEYFLTRNSITGCTMLILQEVAKKHIPFMHDYFVHDHWLALVSSSEGEVSYVNEPLIRYRIHENNQIGSSILKNIDSKKDYNEKKIKKEIIKLNELEKYPYFSDYQKNKIKEKKKAFITKKDFFESPTFRNSLSLIINEKKDLKLLLFEMFIGLAPKKSVDYVFRTIKK